MSIVNTSKEQAALYQFFLQQIAAESYIEVPVDWTDEARLKDLLWKGANRDLSSDSGYQPGHTRLTPQQAAEFVQNYRILDQWSDNPTGLNGPVARPLTLKDGTVIQSNTGFSATLIQDKDTGDLTLAIRSTEFKDWSKYGDFERDGIRNPQIRGQALNLNPPPTEQLIHDPPSTHRVSWRRLPRDFTR